MNGRMYDPLVGRFLSADVVIQDPTNIQNYNRYSYCLNNPLKFNDPSGYKMAAADEGREIDAYFFYLSGVASWFGHSSSGTSGDGASSGGWGGNDGVIPGWTNNRYIYGSNYGSNFGKQLYDAANQLLGSINDDEVYNLTSIDYTNGTYRFTYGKNQLQSERAKEYANFIMYMARCTASNIGYGKSFHREGEASSNQDGYGDTFKERVTNIKLWKQLGKEFLFGNDDPNVIKLSMADNPVSFLMPFGQFTKASLGLKTLGGASKTTMVTTNFFKEIGVRGSMGGQWFTPLGTASNWETFLGRWTPFIMESWLIYDYTKK